MSSMLRRVAFGAGLALIGGTVAAAPAGAAANDGSCDSGEFCNFRDTSLLGPLADYGTSDTNYTDESGADDAMRNAAGAVITLTSGDRMSSAWNRTAVTICISADDSFGGDGTPLGSGVSISSMPGGGADVGDNEASSHRQLTGSC